MISTFSKMASDPFKVSRITRSRFSTDSGLYGQPRVPRTSKVGHRRALRKERHWGSERYPREGWLSRGSWVNITPSSTAAPLAAATSEPRKGTPPSSFLAGAAEDTDGTGITARCTIISAASRERNCSPGSLSIVASLAFTASSNDSYTFLSFLYFFVNKARACSPRARWAAARPSPTDSGPNPSSSTSPATFVGWVLATMMEIPAPRLCPIRAYFFHPKCFAASIA
mmetsp:Transcript_16835/g.27694  ORF Transcript_16835/g.27694 Transcript_16835/m.27694 type:complete len:227 (+) Transcript_16835:286-966(+)